MLIPHNVLVQVMNTKYYNRSIAYHDNRISLYVAQYGKCYITNQLIELDRVHCHHKIPLSKDGSDRYQNLVIVDKDIHKLIHINNSIIIDKYLKIFNLDNKQLNKLNELRLKVGNKPITI